MKGIYLLFVNLKEDSKIKIGSLGNILFRKGNYIYVGSAQNNLKARVERHKRKNKKLFWHIDYFLENKNSKIIDIFYKESPKEDECKTAQKLSNKFKSIENFGCSDCKCKSHLFFIN